MQMPRTTGQEQAYRHRVEREQAECTRTAGSAGRRHGDPGLHGVRHSARGVQGGRSPHWGAFSRRDAVAPCKQAGRTQWRDREARDPIRAEAADGACDSARHHLGHTVASEVDGDGAITTSGTDSDRGIIQTILALSGTGSVPITDAAYRAEADINRDGVISSADVSALGSAKSALAPGEISDRTSGTGPDSIIGWCGYVFIPETGFYHVRFRVYDVGLGRWTSRDPMGYVDGMGGYEYVRSWPVEMVDTTGRSIEDLSLWHKDLERGRRVCRVMTFTFAREDDRKGMPRRTRDMPGDLDDFVGQIRQGLDEASACCLFELQIDAHSGEPGQISIAREGGNDVWIDDLHRRLIRGDPDEVHDEGESKGELTSRAKSTRRALHAERTLKEICDLICDGGRIRLIQCGVGAQNASVDYLHEICGRRVTIITYEGEVAWLFGSPFIWPWEKPKSKTTPTR
ncbi:MAG: hypothetical protein KF817_02870 [Phycisphaeraceae bacterium]|nr:hypothetical protein [Phycisphaeraceae bacterium]